MIEPEFNDRDEPPPFLGTWNRVYLMVAIYLVFTIGALYVFSKSFT